MFYEVSRQQSGTGLLDCGGDASDLTPNINFSVVVPPTAMSRTQPLPEDVPPWRPLFSGRPAAGQQEAVSLWDADQMARPELGRTPSFNDLDQSEVSQSSWSRSASTEVINVDAPSSTCWSVSTEAGLPPSVPVTVMTHAGSGGGGAEAGARKQRKSSSESNGLRAPSRKSSGDSEGAKKSLGNRGVPERMWSQPAPPHSHSSGARADDATSAPQSPCARHSPSSPSFPSRSNADRRSTADRKRSTGNRTPVVPPLALSSPRGRTASDPNARAGENQGNRPSPRERAPSVNARHGTSSETGHLQQERSRRALHGESGKEPRAGERDRLSPESAELERLRAAVERELSERHRLEASSEDAASQLTKAEAHAACLQVDLQEIRSQRDAFRRQLRQRSEAFNEVLKLTKKEQETTKVLQGDLAKAAAARKELETRLKRDRAEKLEAEFVVQELQTKLRQFEKDMAAAAEAKRSSHAELPAGLESQLEELRRQLEETVKVVQKRCGGPADSLEAVEGGQAIERIPSASSKPESLGQELMETSTKCSSIDIAAVHVSSSTEDPLGLGHAGSEEELPADERLIGEWSSISQEVMELSGAQFDEDPTAMNLSASAPNLNGFDGHVGPPTPPARSSGPSQGGPAVRRPSGDRGAPRASGAARSPPAQSPAATPPRSPGFDEAASEVIGGGQRRQVSLSLRDVSEIKCLKKPPPPIRMLMEICCLLFHIKPVKQADEKNSKRFIYDYFEPARRYLLSDPFFPAKLRMYEADHISNALRVKIRRYFQDPEFSAERVRNCSKPAFELYDWVRSLIDPDPMPPRPAGSTWHVGDQADKRPAEESFEKQVSR